MTVTNAIEVKNVSKVYKLYDKSVDRLKEVLFSCFGRRYHREFFALKDINFQVKKRETVGIIGKNGAGKSTLLKIITGVLTPTDGEVTVNGRISSLLELGAGFNPELTGMENIYFNSSLLGLTKEETDAKIDEILEFADIGEFIDQPVKTYSSGMYVRLAFSVAINVEPDILIVDEALAVGDARFQLKCFKKLEAIKKKGTTILFVSHAVDQIRNFCTRAVLIEKGKILFDGDPKEAAIRYFDLIFPEKAECENGDQEFRHEDDSSDINEKDYYFNIPEETNRKQIFGNGGAKIDWIKIYGTNGKNRIIGGEQIKILAQYSWIQEEIKLKQLEENVEGNVGLGIALADEKGNYIFGCNNYDARVFIDYKMAEYAIIELSFTMPYLKSGTYFLTAAISCGNQANHIQLRWYDYFIQLECMTCKKNVNGWMYLDYEMKDVKDHQ